MLMNIAKFFVTGDLSRRLLRCSSKLSRNTCSSETETNCKSDFQCPIKSRLFQFERKNEGRLRVGMTSYTGDCFIDLTGQCTSAKSMKHILEKKCDLNELQPRLKLLRSEWMDDSIRLLSPVVNPTKIVCFDYLVNTFNQCSVLVTNKLPTSLTGPTDDIELEENVESVQITANLAVIIGQTDDGCRRPNIMDFIFGYSIAHNVTAIAAKGSNSVVKNSPLIRTSMRSFCPLGPLIVHKSIITNPHNLWAHSSVNGVETFRGSTDYLHYQIKVILEAILKYTSLNVGDIVLIKIPSDETQDSNYTPCILNRGDVIESEIQDIGKLKNKIVNVNHHDDDDSVYNA